MQIDVYCAMWMRRNIARRVKNAHCRESEKEMATATMKCPVDLFSILYFLLVWCIHFSVGDAQAGLCAHIIWRFCGEMQCSATTFIYTFYSYMRLATAHTHSLTLHLFALNSYNNFNLFRFSFALHSVVIVFISFYFSRFPLNVCARFKW